MVVILSYVILRSTKIKPHQSVLCIQECQVNATKLYLCAIVLNFHKLIHLPTVHNITFTKGGC